MAINNINVNTKIAEVSKNIFLNYDVETLSDYQKRKIIFNYLCDNLEYDWNLYKGIAEFTEKMKISHKPIKSFKRDSMKELHDTIFNHKGICNGIAQYYKLLLQNIGIYSVQICCDDSTNINHALNLVYDKENDSYSFDDVTSIIVERGFKEEFFDYDIEDANKMNQGLRPIYDNNYWVIIPSEYVNYLSNNPDDNFYKQFNLENTPNIQLPENIISLKKEKNSNKSR